MFDYGSFPARMREAVAAIDVEHARGHKLGWAGLSEILAVTTDCAPDSEPLPVVVRANSRTPLLIYEPRLRKICKVQMTHLYTRIIPPARHARDRLDSNDNAFYNVQLVLWPA